VAVFALPGSFRVPASGARGLTRSLRRRETRVPAEFHGVSSPSSSAHCDATGSSNFQTFWFTGTVAICHAILRGVAQFLMGPQSGTIGTMHD
jgi:hypothetical protein